ncbi:MAG: hypothetical protein IID16_02045 [Candidatus Marinimicrobia bacterium]|nr:hypothetical protein [Candidatus Neomarinimicrobiota bacterium]
MEYIYVAVGIIAVVTGLLLLFNPKLLAKVGETLNRTLAVDEIIFSRRSIFGILLVIAGIFMIYKYINLP